MGFMVYRMDAERILYCVRRYRPVSYNFSGAPYGYIAKPQFQETKALSTARIRKKSINLC